MNRQIRQLAGALIVLYVVLFAALNYWQVGRTEELASQPSNTRPDPPVRLAARPDRDRRWRGDRPPGRCPATDVKFRRLYPTGELFANVTGYYTFGLGSTQLEKTRSDVLSGDTFTQQVPSTRCSAARTTSPAPST